MASVQISANNTTVPFIRTGDNYAREAETILQDAGRVNPLVFGTLMAKVAATGKLVPFTDEAATDGSARPYGFYIGADIAGADLVAGDVVDAPVLVGGACTIDENQVVIENSKTLATIIGATVEQRTVRDELDYRGIFVESTVDIDEFEN